MKRRFIALCLLAILCGCGSKIPDKIVGVWMRTGYGGPPTVFKDNGEMEVEVSGKIVKTKYRMDGPNTLYFETAPFQTPNPKQEERLQIEWISDDEMRTKSDDGLVDSYKRHKPAKAGN